MVETSTLLNVSIVLDMAILGIAVRNARQVGKDQRARQLAEQAAEEARSARMEVHDLLGRR